MRKPRDPPQRAGLNYGAITGWMTIMVKTLGRLAPKAQPANTHTLAVLPLPPKCQRHGARCGRPASLAPLHGCPNNKQKQQKKREEMPKNEH